GVIYLVLSTLFLSASLIFYTQQKQLDAQRLLAMRLATERDAIAEYLFDGIYQKIRRDPYIKSYYVNPVISSNFLQKRIKQLYFSGYLNKYDVLVSSYTREGIPFKIDYEKPLAFYLNILERGATPVKDKSLYFLHTYRGLPGYMATIPIVKDGYVLGSLLIQFQQKAFYEESVYPELLLTSNIQHYNELSNYSYAIFNKNTLFTQKGNYPYPSVSLFPPKPDSAGFSRFYKNGYTHLVHFINKDLRVVVSQPQQSIIFFFSIFTSVFLFLGVCWFIVLFFPKISGFFLRQRARKKPVGFYIQQLWAGLSFRYKILSTITGGISLALFLVGFATVAYIVYQYDKDEIKKLERRTKIITARLENELQSNEQASTMGEDELDAMVKNLSDMYRTDINLFDAHGNLLSSTQPGIYDQNIIARKMNARAYMKFHDEFASIVTQEENIGKLNYTAAYTPLRNIFGDIIGYMNIPYFSKEKDLTDRISNFLIALINLYLLIFLILVGLSLFMARALTTPLDIIRNHLRNTSLGGSPIFLQWHTKDEIGKLVNEYNTMLIELQNSASKLAQSEREGAWREMAKQVAHEIKNPLTPMKLNIQRLQMAYHEGKEDIKPLFDKVTALLIRQIDSLSEIATAFSSFAQMPQGTPQTIDANQLMREVSQLFSHQSDANIHLNLLEKPALVKVDPNQLSRVLTNLVKNAVQAFQEGRKGEICLQTSEVNSHILLQVHDNGTGIPEEMQQNIFVPSFSTKTSGMGLGLAISKKIINNAGGDIYFHTEQGKGTTFTIELPKVSVQ
ncbi:MAG: ATP-binding protein, partial [Bacteroidia bacterium]